MFRCNIFSKPLNATIPVILVAADVNCNANFCVLTNATFSVTAVVSNFFCMAIILLSYVRLTIGR
jgi:hypothetical protein